MKIKLPMKEAPNWKVGDLLVLHHYETADVVILTEDNNNVRMVSLREGHIVTIQGQQARDRDFRIEDLHSTLLSYGVAHEHLPQDEWNMELTYTPAETEEAPEEQAPNLERQDLKLTSLPDTKYY